MSRATELLRRCRATLAEGFWSEGYTCLNQLCQLGGKLKGAGPELASAESYRVSEDLRQLFRDRIEQVNAHLRGEA